MSADGEVITKTQREIKGKARILLSIIAISMSLFHLWVNSIGVISGIYRNAIHLSFLLVLCFLLYPAFKGKRSHRIGISDIILAVAGVAVGVYILLFERELHLERASIPIFRDYLFAALSLILVLEASRRCLGIVLPILAIFFLIYAHYGSYFPEIIAHKDIPWTRILYRMYLTDEGLFGITLSVSATFIFLFVLFGAFLQKSGAAEFINRLALALAGRKRGGPAQVAVIASSLMGTLSGSAAANVATTGTFTIPLMKKVGFKPEFAGAIEAAASTGGMIMPPIMGAAAFIMSAFLGIPYTKIMIGAFIPALLYYLAVAFVIDLEAKKMKLKGLPKEILPDLKEVLKTGGHLLLPVIAVVVTLLKGFTPLYAAFVGIITTIVVSYFRKETRLGLKDILKALEIGAIGSIQVGIACAICGIIVGVINMTGLGSMIAYNVINLANGKVFWTLLFAMFSSVLLGMGLPSTALYIVVATVVAPAIIQLGVIPLAAHLFVFWFGALSNVVPPVALASYTAAGIAGGDPTKTALYGLKLTLAGFIIPFAFVYAPELLLHHVSPELPLILITTIVGIISLGIATQGYFLYPTRLLERTLYFVAALCLIKPDVLTDLIGFLIFVGTTIFHKYKPSFFQQNKRLEEVSEIEKVD